MYSNNEPSGNGLAATRACFLCLLALPNQRRKRLIWEFYPFCQSPVNYDPSTWKFTFPKIVLDAEFAELT